MTIRLLPVKDICVSELGHHSIREWLVAERHQAIIWTNAGSLLIEPFGTKFSQILIAIHGHKPDPGGDSSSNALVETRHFFYKTCEIYVLFTQRSFDISRQNLHICNFAVIHYQLLWPNCCKTSTFGDIKAITCDSACRGHYGTSAWPRSMHEPSTHCDYSSMKRGSPAIRASRIYSNLALTPSWRRLITENWHIFIQKMDLKMKSTKW